MGVIVIALFKLLLVLRGSRLWFVRLGVLVRGLICWAIIPGPLVVGRFVVAAALLVGVSGCRFRGTALNALPAKRGTKIGAVALGLNLPLLRKRAIPASVAAGRLVIIVVG